MNILDVSSAPVFDNRIDGIEYHSYKPYVTSFNRNDEIRIPINQQDVCVLLSSSTLYLEGVVKVMTRGVPPAPDTRSPNVLFTNNYLMYLFENISYQMNGVEIDRVKNAGITTTMKSLISMNENEAKMAMSWGWNIDGTRNTNEGKFSVSIPLKNILGVAEDFKRILLNCRHELVLLRSNTNLNALQITANEYVDDIDIKQIVWRVPHVKVSDREKINLLNFLERDRPLQIVFRNWDLYEYPLLPQTTKHTWAIKTSSQIEKPRYVIVGLQTSKKNNGTADMSRFDSCNLRDVKVYLNSTYFPYESIDVNFTENKIALLYESFATFRHSYYGRPQEPLLSSEQFIAYAPLFVIDCSRQIENLNSGPVVNIRVELESHTAIPDQTTAYCLILNDCIFEYKPLSGIVKKIS